MANTRASARRGLLRWPGNRIPALPRQFVSAPFCFRSMGTCCGEWFRYWQHRLERESEPWGVRCPTTGWFWHNKEMSKATQVRSGRWTFIMGKYSSQARYIEDMHSLALKTGKAVVFELMQPSGGKVLASVILVRCPKCRPGCGLLLGHFAGISLPLPEAMPSD